MHFRRFSKALFAVLGALALTATSAGAHSGHAFNFSVSNNALNANANFTSALTFGAYEANIVEFDLAAGIKLAHDDQHGNELASNPNDEENIGSGSAKANWNLFLGCSTSTQSLTITWEEDMTGAPAGAVAHYVVTNALGFDTNVWAIEQNDAADDYKLYMDLDEGRTCSTQPTDANASVTTLGTTSGGRIVSQNPSTSGCYTINASFTDTAGGSHSGTDSQAFGTGSC